MVLPQLEPGAGRGSGRRVRPAHRPGDQAAVAGDADGHGHSDRPGGTRRGDTVRRALRGPGRGGPPAFLRPAARRLRRAPPDGVAIHPPDRRGRRPAGAGADDRPRADRARCRCRRCPRRSNEGERPGRRCRGVRGRPPDLGPAPGRLARVGRGRQNPRPRRLARARELHLNLEPLSLQQMVVHAAGRATEDLEEKTCA